MIPFIVIAVSIGGLAVLLSDIGLLFDDDSVIYGVVNLVGAILLLIGLLAGFNKTQTVYCPECGDKKDPIVVAVDEHYCSACGSEYVVLG